MQDLLITTEPQYFNGRMVPYPLTPTELRFLLATNGRDYVAFLLGNYVLWFDEYDHFGLINIHTGEMKGHQIMMPQEGVGADIEDINMPDDSIINEIVCIIMKSTNHYSYYYN